MSRFLKHPNNLTPKDLENYDWDLIELPITLDTESWHEWYYTIKEKFDHYSYNLDVSKELIGDQITRDFIFENMIHSAWGNPKQWMLQWSIQREGVLPPYGIANPEIFEEMSDISNHNKVNLAQYMFGAYQKFHDIMGSDCFSITKLLEYLPDEGVKPHVDVADRFMTRMLIHIKNPEATVTFSENRSSLLTTDYEYNYSGYPIREYTLEEGKVYLLNTAITHSMRNLSNNTTALIQTDPTDEVISRVLTEKGIHIC